MAAPGWIRCRTCGHDNRRLPARWVCPSGHLNGVARRRCGQCAFRLAADEVPVTWWVLTCGACHGPVVSEGAPLAVVRQYAPGDRP